MADPFARMHDRLLAHLGSEAVLRGSENIKVNVEHGVGVQGEYGEVVAFKTMAHIPSSLAPRLGNTLLIEGKTWVIDSLESDDGYMTRVWLR